MKKLATCIIAIAGLIGTPAFAADMAVKAPPPAPAPVPTWTGFYVGGNIGASFGRAKTDYNVAPVAVTTVEAGTSIPGPTFTTPGFAGSNTESPDGFMGGGQIGYNWQYSPLIVVGLEADFQGALERDSITLTNSFGSITGLTGTAVTQYEAKIDWFGTARVRVGYVWGNGAVMSYVTGGLAYGRVGVDGTSTVSGVLVIPTNTFSATHTVGHSQVNTGWTVGYGTEGKLLIPGWTYKIEYLYVDLGSLDDTDAVAEVSGASGGQIFTHTHFTDGILRAGLNYQFH